MAFFRYVILVLLLLTIVAAVLMLSPLYRDRQDVTAELQNANRTYLEKRRAYEQRLVWRKGLQNDPRVVERYAREKLGYSSEGEHITNVVEE